MDHPRHQQACQLIDQSGPDRVAEQLKRFLKPTIRMDSSPASTQLLPVGTSKLGGLPDLSPALVWPAWEEVPMVFLAQINLQDVAPYDQERLLPPHGMLSFFCQSQDLVQGVETKAWDSIDPDEPESWRVLFFDGNMANLRTLPPPKGLVKHALLRECKLHARPALTLPPLWSPPRESLRLTMEEFKQYQRLLATIEGTFLWSDDHIFHHHRLLGYPFQMQGDMQLQCQMASLRVKDWRHLDEQEQASLRTTALQWVLLLQIDSDEYAQISWGEMGSFSYWIKQTDRERRNFAGCWAIEDSL